MNRTEYSEELMDKIFDEISGSTFGLVHILKRIEGAPVPSTFFKWLTEKPGLSEKYARAKELQAEYMADEMLQIADDGTNDFMTIVKGDQEYVVENKEWTSRSKLRVDTRKWLASKLLPKKYGDRQDINMHHSVNDGAVIDWGNSNKTGEGNQ